MKQKWTNEQKWKYKWTFLFDHNVISYLYIKDFFGTNEICGCWVFRISTFRILKRLIGFYVCVCWRRLFQSFDDVKNSKYGRMREIPPQQNQNSKICFIFLLSTIPNIFLSFNSYIRNLWIMFCRFNYRFVFMI